MAKAKSRLLIHHAKDAQPPGHKFTTLSNTAKRLRKVFTSAPLSSTPPNPDAPPTGSDGLASSEIPIDHSTELGTSSDADTQQPAGGVRVRTKAKRYLNSVSVLFHSQITCTQNTLARMHHYLLGEGIGTNISMLA